MVSLRPSLHNECSELKEIHAYKNKTHFDNVEIFYGLPRLQNNAYSAVSVSWIRYFVTSRSSSTMIAIYTNRKLNYKHILVRNKICL